MNCNQLEYRGISYKDFVRMIDNMFDEVIVYDRDAYVVYVNKACARHYGCRQSEMIGRSFYSFQEDAWWDQSILPVVIREEKIFAIRQKTKLNTMITTVASPVFDDHGRLTHVIMNVHDDIQEKDLYYVADKEIPVREELTIFHSRDKKVKQLLQKVDIVERYQCNCVIYGEISTGKQKLAHYIQSIMPADTHVFELDGPEYAPGLEQLEHNLCNISSGQISLLIKHVESIPFSDQRRLISIIRQCESRNIKLQCISTCLQNDLALLENLQEKQLFYYLNAVSIEIPPLRKRRQDLPELISFYLSRFTECYNVVRSLTPDLHDFLIDYKWPGNLEEVQHVLMYLVLNSTEIQIGRESLPPYLMQKSRATLEPQEETFELSTIGTFDEKVEAYERYLVRQALHQKSTSRGVAAILGISQTRAANLIRKYRD